MRWSRTFSAAFAIVLMLGTGGRTSAQDFTVNVPVGLERMPSLVTAVIIVCVALCVGCEGLARRI